MELGEEWLPLVQSWGSLEEVLNALDAGGAPATAEVTLFNTQPVAGRARVSDLLYSPRNTTGYEFAFAKVQIYRLEAGLTTGDELLVGTFYLEEPTEIGEQLFHLRMGDITLVLEDKPPATVILRSDFPNCPATVVGQTIPRVFGSFKNIPTVPVVDGAVSQLDGAITASATTLVLVDAGDFPDSGKVGLEKELADYSAKSGNTLSGLTRGVNGSTAATHDHGTSVFVARTGTNAYRVAVGENARGFKINSVSGILVNGKPPTTGQAPTMQLDATDLVPGRSFAVVSFTPTDVLGFHIRTEITGSIETHDATNVPLLQDATPNTVDGSPTFWNFGLTPTLPVFTGGGGSVHRKATTRYVVLGGSLSPGDPRRFVIQRRDPVTLAWIDVVLNPIPGTSYTLEYDTGTSVADEQWQVEINGGADNFHFNWFINTYRVTQGADVTSVPLLSTTSTLAALVGAVTCDVEGLQDDPSGTISGTPKVLLENPADIAKCILLGCYPGVSLADLGSRWAATRVSTGGLKWAFLLGADGPMKFSELRRKIGEQARSELYVEGGKLELRYLPDAPTADLTLDYLRDVWSQAPATASRSNRTQLFTSVVANARRDYSAAGGGYRYTARARDLTQPGLPDPIETTLSFDFVQDAATADALAAFWLGRWKRQRWQVELVAWQNILSVEKGDHLAIDNHPVLAAHGGTALVFRIVAKRYLLADANPARIRLTAIEANP
ncbi:MAG TPA: hypothetical protein VGV13_00960 [Methylomirabilota bacterium]|nr:hypothetical protein [Methylomirabilota bacterium]